MKSTLAFIAMLLAGLAALPAFAVCPDPALAEKSEDCPWAEITRTYLAGEQAPEGFMKLLNAQVPDLAEDIRADADRDGLLDLWGRSFNYDELAKSEIVIENILASLETAFFGKPLDLMSPGETPRRLTHAGMEHTYGYLFSNLKTSFGYKRARWVAGELERGFAIEAGLLGPRPSKGSLFSNATWMAGQIAFRDEAPLRLRLTRNASAVAPALRQFNFKKLDVTRLEEVIRVSEGRKVILRTDFVPFLKAPTDPAANSQWLIYSYVDSSEKHAKLVTAFPVAAGFASNALAPAGLGSDKPIITRYNAFIDGVSGKSWTGTRRALAPN